MKNNKEETLIQCIDDIQSGKYNLEECVNRYPEIGSELREYYRLVKSITSESVSPSLEFKIRARNRLMGEMNSIETAPVRSPYSVLGGLFVRRFGYGLTIALTVLAGGGITAYASQGSLPQDTLYPVKTMVENIQMALTVNPEAKAELHLKLAERRVQEVTSEAESGHEITASTLQSAVNELSNAVTDIEKVPESKSKTLLTRLSQSTTEQQSALDRVALNAPESAQPALKQAIDATRRGSLIASVARDNPALLSSGASVHDKELETTYFEIQGNLTQVAGSTWTIGSITLQNVKTPPGTTPRIGNNVKLNGFVRGGDTIIGNLDWQDTPPADTSIQGIFSGARDNGTVWQVGGVPITVKGSQNSEPPAEDDRVQVNGPAENRSYTVLEDRSESSQKNNRNGGSENDRNNSSVTNQGDMQSNQSNIKKTSTSDNSSQKTGMSGSDKSENSNSSSSTSNTTSTYNSKSGSTDGENHDGSKTSTSDHD